MDQNIPPLFPCHHCKRAGIDVASKIQRAGSGSGAGLPPPTLHGTALRAAVLAPDAAHRLPQDAQERLPAILASLRPFMRPLPPSQAPLVTPVGEAAAAALGSADVPGEQAGAAVEGGVVLDGAEVVRERQALAHLREQCR